MFNDHESADSPRSLLGAAVATALDRLDHLRLADGILEGLTRHVLANDREAMGVDAAAAHIARHLIDQRMANIREAIGRLSKMVAPGREPEAVGALSKFSQEAVESLTLGNLADVERRLTAFSFEINRLSALSGVPPKTLNGTLDMYSRPLVAAGWNGAEAEFLAVELVRTGEALASFDARGATTASGRRILRQMLRECNAPRAPEYRDKFMNSFPKIPEQ